jgi:hypothetical protein
VIKRRVPLWVTISAVVVAMLVGVAAGGGGKKDEKSAASVAVTVTATPPPAAAAAAGAPATTVTVTAAQAAKAAAPVTVTATAPAPSSAAPAGIGDGTYIVGTDIKPGLYKTTGPAASDIPDCYWERDRDLEDGINSIIANDNAKGPTTVKIASTDKAFKTTGCSQWVKIG